MRRFLAIFVVLVLVAAGCTKTGEESSTTTTTSSTVPTTTTTTEPAVLTGVGIEDDVITLAAMLPLSGSLESFGRSALAGHEVYWKYVNEALGGVGGSYPVRFAPLDTGYDEETARGLLAEAKDDILAVSSVIGSLITNALLTEVGDEQILLAAGSQASSWGTSPNTVLNLALPTYRDQISGVLLTAGTEEPPVQTPTPLGLLYQESVYGEDCLAGFDQATDRLPDDVLVRVGYPAAETDFGDELAVMSEAGVATLLVCSTSQALTRIVGTLPLLDYRPVVIAAAQSYDPSVAVAIGGDGGEEDGVAALSDLRLVGSLPPFEGDAPGMKLLRDNLARFGEDVPVDSWFFLGYTQAATIHVILEEAFDAGDLTRAGIWAARDRLGEIDFGFGAGPARLDENRVPIVADAVAQPAPSGDFRFGMQPVGAYYPTR